MRIVSYLLKNKHSITFFDIYLLSLIFVMVKINVNNFLDVLSNEEVRRKFADLLDLSSAKQKLEGLQATIDSLCRKLVAYRMQQLIKWELKIAISELI